MPLISVIIPTFNSSRYIGETLDAILRQTFQDFEIVIIDDCSTDDTLEKIRSIKDARIRIAVNDRNRGIAYTHNKLLESCTGEYIAIQDHDDISYPYRLKVQSDFLNKNPDLLATASYANYINEKGEYIYHPLIRKTLRLLGLNNSNIDEKDIFANLLFKNPFCHSTLMLNRKNMGPLQYGEDFKICDDYDLLVRIAATSPIKIESTPVLKYRVHQQNTSSVRYKERETEVNKIQSRYLSLLNIAVTTENLFVHNGYFNDISGYRPSVEYLNKSIEWYKLLIDKNHSNAVYDTLSLENAIEQNWYERCYISRQIGLDAVRLYYKNSFTKKTGLKKTGKLIVLALSIIFSR